MSYNPHHDVVIGGLIVPVNGPLGQGLQVMPHLLSDEIALRVLASILDAPLTTEPSMKLVERAYEWADLFLAERSSRMAAAKLAEEGASKLAS